MLNILYHAPFYLAQAYGRGTYNSLRYQETTTIGPIKLPVTLPSVGTSSLFIASVVALVASITIFMLHRSRQKKADDR